MPGGVDELWNVAQRPFEVDASALACALETAASDAPLDYRTRLLVRDSVRALEAHWGAERFAEWFQHSPRRHQLTQIRASVEAADDVAFPYLASSIVDAIKPEVEGYDAVVGKLFSNREKDRDDLRAVAPQLDRETLVRRVRETTASFRADAKLLAAAEKNWFIVFGESLPS